MDYFAYALIAAFLFFVAYIGLVIKYVVHEFECGLMYRNGRYRKRVGPGAHRVLRPWTKITSVDLRKHIGTVSGQEVLTVDQVGVKVSLVVTYEIRDPVKALHEVADYSTALHVAVQVALRKLVGGISVDDLLGRQLEIGSELTSEAQSALEETGLQVHSVAVKDVMLPGEMRRAFSEVVRARKEGQASLERTRGETAALRNLANAAKMLRDNPDLLNLRLLQMLSANTAGQTVVFNAPRDSVQSGLQPVKPSRPDEQSLQ
ncbi:MAG: slipin family protein [Phycisphaerae bacterium]|nr:slipin family protein [Phycisphaerae bacterium]